MIDTPLPSWAADYVGIPYVKHGRTREGCDCWGLLCLIWREQLGGALPEYEGVDWYRGQQPAVIGTDALAYAAKFDEVPPGEEQLGDAILMRMRGHPFHVGLVLTPGLMVHTHEEADSVIERYRVMTWEKRISAFYRLKPA